MKYLAPRVTFVLPMLDSRLRSFHEIINRSFRIAVSFIDIDVDKILAIDIDSGVVCWNELSLAVLN